jgi:hypothetical protein
VSDPGPSALAAPGRATDLFGALAAPGASVANWPQADRSALAAELVPASGARILGPPVYGALATNVAGVPQTGAHRWLGQLNLHPARRAAAGMGAAIVRRRQADFVQEAWEQAWAGANAIGLDETALTSRQCCSSTRSSSSASARRSTQLSAAHH